MTLLGEVSGTLERAGVPHALIGAAALTVHGVSRATVDVDVLTAERRTLQAGFWSELSGRGVALRVLVGDVDDPLAGSVRLTRGAEIVDVVVGRYGWEREQIEAAVVRPVGELRMPVVGPVGLVLLKLHAGSPKDAWDVQALLEAVADPSGVAAEVERTLPRLPAEAQRLWERIRALSS